MAHCGVPAENNEFRDEFFPKPDDPSTVEPRKKLTTNPFIKLVGASESESLPEKKVADEFTAAINDNDLVPGFKIAQCGNRPDSAYIDPEKQKIDAAFYRTHLTPTDGRPHWGDQLVAVEFKRHDNAKDPFDDSKENISTDTDSRKQVRGQIITYAELIFAVQQRVALFMLVVVGRNCRFVRWDRSGTIVTRALNYVENWDLFCDILWRMSLCSDVQLGLDPTATRLFPDDDDYTSMTDAANLEKHKSDVDHTERELQSGEIPANGFVFRYVREMFRKSLVSEWPRYRLEVPSGDTFRSFLVCKPVFCATGMAGRGTRGYVALECDIEEERFVWLKDAWRAHYILVEEGDILTILRDAKIMYVPTVLCHGDILDQTTRTPEWWERKNPLLAGSISSPPPPSIPTEHPTTPSSRTLAVPQTTSSRTLAAPSSSGMLKRKREDDGSDDGGDGSHHPVFREDCPLRLHRHYRLVEAEVAIPLSEFQYGGQLVSIVADCVFAHFSAATNPNTRLLHRDISGGNILILPKIEDGMMMWTGLLADWEMSKPIHQPGETRIPRQPERTGTWQYMSVALLTGPKLVEICDELEAFLYVLIYYAVRYLKSNIDGKTAANFIDEFFDTYGLKGDTYVCGTKKSTTIHAAELTIDADMNIEFDSPMDEVLSTLLHWFKAHSIVTRYEKLQQKAAAAPAATQPRGAFRRRLANRCGTEETEMTRSILDEERPQNIPSAYDWEHRDYVMTHSYMKKLLDEYVQKVDWPLGDKAGDRIPADYKPIPELFGPFVRTSNKKAKIEGPEAKSMPLLSPRAPVTPVKSRGPVPKNTAGED